MKHLYEYTDSNNTMYNNLFITYHDENMLTKALRIIDKVNFTYEQLQNFLEYSLIHNHHNFVVLMLKHFDYKEPEVISALAWTVGERDSVTFDEIYKHYKDKINIAAHENIILNTAIQSHMYPIANMIIENHPEIFDNLGYIDFNTITSYPALFKAAIKHYGVTSVEDLKSILSFLS